MNLITTEEIQDYTCIVDELPDDFYDTFWLGKYLANSEGIYLNETWVDPESLYKYFLIPSDMVSQIAHYSGFVKEAMFHKSFNVKVSEIETTVEGQAVMSPLFINYIPCSCTHWTDEGLQLLEAVVENWNVSNDLKKMIEPYKFESYAELEAFIQNNNV